MGYRICRYEACFRDQVLALQRHLWSDDSGLNDRYFTWKYERNPYLPEPLICLALEGDRVVGMRGAYGAPWVLEPGARPLRALCLGDSVVAPDHRRRGLAKRVHEALVAEARNAGWAFVLNTSAGGVMRRISLQSGWKATEEIRPLARSDTVNSSLPSRLSAWLSDRFGGIGRRPLEALEGRVRRAEELAGGPVSFSTASRPTEMAALAASTGARAPIRESRDTAFFDWRFSNPMCGYRFFFHEGEVAGGGLTGYVAVQAHRPPHDTGLNLVDWEASSPEALALLLDAVLAVAGGERVTTWPGGDAALRATFRDAGFRPVRRPSPPWVLPTLLTLPLERADSRDAWITGGVDLLELENWDLRMTASDFY